MDVLEPMPADRPHPLRKKEYDEMSEEEELEGESEESDEDDPANQTVIRVGKDDSLSLKAQVVSSTIGILCLKVIMIVCVCVSVRRSVASRTLGRRRSLQY